MDKLSVIYILEYSNKLHWLPPGAVAAFKEQQEQQSRPDTGIGSPLGRRRRSSVADGPAQLPAAPALAELAASLLIFWAAAQRATGVLRAARAASGSAGKCMLAPAAVLLLQVVIQTTCLLLQPHTSSSGRQLLTSWSVTSITAVGAAV
jgi:hypothetical protein